MGLRLLWLVADLLGLVKPVLVQSIRTDESFGIPPGHAVGRSDGFQRAGVWTGFVLVRRRVIYRPAINLHKVSHTHAPDISPPAAG